MRGEVSSQASCLGAKRELGGVIGDPTGYAVSKAAEATVNQAHAFRLGMSSRIASEAGQADGLRQGGHGAGSPRASHRSRFRQNGAMDDDQEAVRRLLDAVDQYSPHYDEVFWEVSARIREHGEAGKLDLAALICWKRSGQGHWAADLMEMPDVEVRKHTSTAFADELTDQQRLDALAPLPGFKRKYAISTAVLACNDPDDFGVIDWRALQGLERIGRPVRRGRGETLRYLERLRELRALAQGFRPGVTARNIDQGLWLIGGS
jgi:hypothetical protein